MNAPAMYAVGHAALPAIGQPWPTIPDSAYAGLSRGEDGQPDAHLVLLAVKAPELMKWADAVAWAEGLGEGARLPTRFESALLYANLQDQFDPSYWHWTLTQFSRSFAYFQYFYDGGQTGNGKSFEACARAVRRFNLESLNPSGVAA